MLCLSRKKNEQILIGKNITVEVLAIRGEKVRLGITAPIDVSIDRKEIREAKLRDENEKE